MIVQIAVYVIVMLSWSFYKTRYYFNKKQPKEAVIYSCLMGVCAILGSLVIAHIHVPSSTVLARLMFEHFGKIILQQ
ncbi:hypothetical protein [Paenibacillus qinlingensis]|uniref:hypothetical protein n=1 Tax=Paenibacillus qinlingensis TaxID=1837343 RepID=UPI001564E92E|nr:hypothetical protein [Paenibacillus qinlingensis]NQX58286.1 hypothetical protein [Paenibacillus qinlingensis]